MRTPRLAGLAAAALLGLAACGEEAPEADDGLLSADASIPRAFEEGLALGVVFDTSGSMTDSVRQAAGGEAPKWVVANRALEAVVRRLEDWAKGGTREAPRRLETGLVVFEGSGAAPAVPFGRFDPAAVRAWIRGSGAPDGNTPLGRAIRAAGASVLRSPLSKKHLLVLTDGESNTGVPPDAVVRNLAEVAKAVGTEVSVHFVAFDVAASVFGPVKDLGATVVSAADEADLAMKLSLILEEEILLEK